MVFQTLYELCTNESVKSHIKLMREGRETAFNCPDIAAQLTEMAATVDEEDGFYNFPITSILKTLYAATSSEEFRAILKKMNQTAAGIFLDSILPVEGEMAAPAPPAPAAPGPAAEAAAPPGPAADSPAGPGPADLKALETLAGEIEALTLAALTPAMGEEGPPLIGEPAADAGLYTSILTQDRTTIVQTVAMITDLIQRTGANLNHILETLSFQDLSGQRIKKVVALISDIQAQLLAILVSVNTKMKVHQETGEMEVRSARTEKMAQDEVDKALEKLGAAQIGEESQLLGPGAENSLNQNAVNDLLANLGF